MNPLQIKDLEEEKITLNNQVFEMNVKLSELKNQGTKSRMNPVRKMIIFRNSVIHITYRI